MSAEDRADDLARRIAEIARQRDITVGVAESLTGGLVSSALARAEGASEWFDGGVVAYGRSVKHELLGVRPGPVVSEEAAVDMAEGTVRVLGVDVAVAVTGAGGPDPQDGQPPGTVWLAAHVDGETRTRQLDLDGDPPEICHDSVVAALDHLLTALDV